MLHWLSAGCGHAREVVTLVVPIERRIGCAQARGRSSAACGIAYADTVALVHVGSPLLPKRACALRGCFALTLDEKCHLHAAFLRLILTAQKTAW